MNGFATSAMLWGALLLYAATTRADSFRSVGYDYASDELVLDMAYSGTNPGHNFALQFGECRTLDSGQNLLEADVVDDQFRDAARQEFNKTVRLSLAQIPCRAVRLTLHTAPNFVIALDIPARH